MVDVEVAPPAPPAPPGPHRIGPEPLRQFARAVRRSAPLICFLLAVTAFYVFIVSAGTWTHWRTWTVFYDAQAEGFRHGHLYLTEVPSAALKALRDPYDPTKMQVWRWDHVYYAGHFYIYWGLVPAVFLAAFKTIFRIHTVIGDDVIVFIFVVSRLLAGTLFIRALAARFEPRPRGWAVWLAMAVFSIAHPTPYLLARCGIYEGAIVGGACFTVTGLYLAFRGIVAAEPRAADRWLAAASVGFGLAAGTRVSLFPMVTALVCFTAFVRWRIEVGDRDRLWRIGLWACGPAAVLEFGHLLMNRLRFGAWTEFGASYQLGLPIKVGLRFVIPNVFAYFFCPPIHTCKFPFLFGHWDTTRGLAPSWLPWPVDYQSTEPVAGLLTMTAFAWLAVGGLGLAATRLRARGRAGVEAPRSAAVVWADRWIWGALVLYVVGSAAPLLLLSASTMRYEADFASGILLIATLVGWRLVVAPAYRAGRTTAATLFGLIAVGTVLAGALFGFTGYFEHFKRDNPTLLHRLEKALSLCGPP